MTAKLLETIANPLRAIYRQAPLPAPIKSIIKSIVMRSFAFLLADTATYQSWKAYREIQYFKSPSQKSHMGWLASLFSKVDKNSLLKNADGVWEWVDYSLVDARIRTIEHRRKSSFKPTPIPIIRVNGNFLEVAKRIKFPNPGENPDVSVVIPVFNNVQLTLECLLSISVHLGEKIRIETIVADDASTDDTANILKDIPNIRIRRNKNNHGFLRNCNSAIESVKGRYTLFLNNDVQVTEGWLEPLVETFTIYKSVGAVGPRILYPSGYLQEAGAALRHDGLADMVGLNEDPNQPRYQYARRVDYCSGACLMLPTNLLKRLGGFSDEFAPSYCEDSDLCLKVREAGYDVYYNPVSTIVHHLSKTMSTVDDGFKQKCISTNLVKFTGKWSDKLDRSSAVRSIAFYLPQFHPIPENDLWWGKGFTEWSNVSKARPNFQGHYQPRLPADFGFYDLRVAEVLDQQAELAKRYGLFGFCYYYYWFAGKRLLEMPLERMLKSGQPNMPFCLCWANENWTRRWDGRDKEILIAQAYSDSDEKAVIHDLIRFFVDDRYIRVDGRPLVLVYRVDLLPNFRETADLWRSECRKAGVGDIYIAMVESFGLVHAAFHPSTYGCDAAVEFPPQGLARRGKPSGKVLNKDFRGAVGDYRELATCYATRDLPSYTRFLGVMPGWDNTARRQNDGFCFEHSSPGAFQAWAEVAIRRTRLQHFGDERLLFVNAWNEWAEGAHLEPDSRFGHAYLEAFRNALDSSKLLACRQHAFNDGS